MSRLPQLRRWSDVQDPHQERHSMCPSSRHALKALAIVSHTASYSSGSGSTEHAPAGQSALFREAPGALQGMLCMSQ